MDLTNDSCCGRCTQKNLDIVRSFSLVSHRRIYGGVQPPNEIRFGDKSPRMHKITPKINGKPRPNLFSDEIQGSNTGLCDPNFLEPFQKSNKKSSFSTTRWHTPYSLINEIKGLKG